MGEDPETSQTCPTDKLVGLKESTKGGSDDVEMVMQVTDEERERMAQ